MKCLCLQALTIVYGKCFEEIGPFTDTKYIVGMLDRVSTVISSVHMVKTLTLAFLSLFSNLEMHFCGYSVQTNWKETGSSFSLTN